MTATIVRYPLIMMMSLLAACQAPSPTADLESAVELEIVMAPEPAMPWVIATPIVPVAAPAAVTENPDLWREIRNSFQLDHNLTNRRVQQEIRWLTDHPRYLENLKSRMSRYLAYIHNQVRERNLPGELALLPIIESALDPYAFSPGGAAGLWQFMPATARQFGLARNWWYDGRRDPIASTDAALNYLENLYARFGDWSLAIAGYNAGEGNVQRAIRRAPQSTDFWGLPLPRETKAYVPRLFALSAVINDPERYSLTLPEIAPTMSFVAIDTQSQFDLMKASAILELTIDTLYLWNPALNQWATPPEGPHRLLIPNLEGGQTPEQWASLARGKLLQVPENERVNWLRVTVKSGDTLGEIAERHRIDVAAIKRANRLRGSNIRAGQALFIPKSSEALTAYPIAARTAGLAYRVKPGDSLWSISRAFDVSLKELIKLNQVGPKEVLRVGRSLNVPGASQAVLRKVRYGVRRGDSLAKIADRFNVKVHEIAQWNRLDVGNYLQPGQSLMLYVNVAAGD
ncbi:MAG: LysM peptidoglycan-binding domain-containing protein [Gammaproteobacteria bacterium]|nr:LysM peptidoglycan-binding domain-containing protein [Gammaproteobacteria bacterium]